MKLKQIKLPSLKNEDLAYLCGVLAGDGSIYVNYKKYDYAIKCVGNPIKERGFYNDIIAPLFFNLFSLIVIPKFHDKETTYGISLSSKNLVNFLVDLGLPCGKKYDQLKIPEPFLKKRELTFAFVRGLADTDFCLTLKRGKYPRIIGTSKSNPFMLQVYSFLKKESFCPYFQKREYYDKRVDKIEITYSISLSGHKQLILWLNKIGFRNNRNLKQVKEWITKNNSNNKVATFKSQKPFFLS